MKVNVTGYSEVIKKIQDESKNLKSYGLQLANEAAIDLKAHYTQIMTDFYNSYAPKFYKRTGNLGKMVKTYTGGIQMGAYGGVVISSNFPPNYKSGRNITEVADMMWNQGIRYRIKKGDSIQEYPYNPSIITELGTYSGTPYAVMAEYFNDYYRNGITDKVNKYIDSNFHL